MFQTELSLLPQVVYFTFCRMVGHQQLLGSLTKLDSKVFFFPLLKSFLGESWNPSVVLMHFISTTSQFLTLPPLLVSARLQPQGFSLLWMVPLGPP